MYYLNNDIYHGRGVTVAVVGCGGTGAFVAEGLCRLLPENMSLLLIDHDKVEETNLVRQNFTAADLGKFKSEALAKRLSHTYGRPVGYSIAPVGFANMNELLQRREDVLIGCVDNGLARRDIALSIQRGHMDTLTPWWIDAGNSENYGQVVIGNCTGGFENSFDPEKGICRYLPLPSIQRPELLLQKPLTHSCAEDVAAGEQSPVINQVMAAIVLEVVRRFIAGTCPWMQLYLDLEAGSLTPVLATPEAVSKITRMSVNKLKRR